MTSLNSLDKQDIAHSAREAWNLLCLHRGRWLCIGILFMLMLESLMLIPYVGFLLKLPLAAILSAQFLRMHMMVEHGIRPGLLSMFGGFSMPWPTLALLALSGLLTFGIGIAVLYVVGGSGAIRFFFGTFRQYPPPDAMQFMQFKLSMQVLGAILSFLPAALVLTRLPALAALRLSMANVYANTKVIAIMLGIGCATEAISFALPHLLGKAALFLILPLLIFLILWLPAFRYTTGKVAFYDAYQGTK